MPTYIRSTGNRFYAAVETSYGVAAEVTSTHRFPATRVQAQQIVEATPRLDKTGSRTLTTSSREGRRRTAFEIRTYLSGFIPTGQTPYGALVQAAMGAEPHTAGGLAVNAISGPTTFGTSAAHGWNVGSAVSNG